MRSRPRPQTHRAVQSDGASARCSQAVALAAGLAACGSRPSSSTARARSSSKQLLSSPPSSAPSAGKSGGETMRRPELARGETSSARCSAKAAAGEGLQGDAEDKNVGFRRSSTSADVGSYHNVPEYPGCCFGRAGRRTDEAAQVSPRSAYADAKRFSNEGC